ncbi:WD40-repeat-containing domain protein [Microdochium bolleyi]|uniref:WD40-repeat-containing domain protein n=1 Tax=Microdochium bolleyi TaxID=196109 RepID=A0A136J6V7_9PEZI|nr:WD40-repeat-containing domain protein [Microdochium bolleyi]
MSANNNGNDAAAASSSGGTAQLPSAGAAATTTAAFAPQQPGATTPAPGSATTPGAAAAAPPPPPASQDLNKIVTDYLVKKGFNRTNAIFTQEIRDLDESGKPKPSADLKSAGRFRKAFTHLEKWVENGLDLHKFELWKVMWPVFVYFYLDLVSQGSYAHAEEFLDKFRGLFENSHREELQRIATIKSATHVKDNQVSQLYLNNRYRIPMSVQVSGRLFSFLERDEDLNRPTIDVLQERCSFDVVERGPLEPFSFEAIYRRARHMELDDVDAQEGLPGSDRRSGVTNRDILDNTATLKLGPLPMDPELRTDVAAELEDEDKIHPPKEGKPTLVDEFNQMHPIKKEAEDSPSRTDIPYPPSRARDVVMEMQKVRENRDRFRIEGRTGGVGTAASVCMFTFHNTLGNVSAMDFSKDSKLVAVGTTDSYIRVWSLDGKELKSKMPNDTLVTNNRKLIGHSAPVYSVSFADSIANAERDVFEADSKPETDTKLLLSCSADGQIRLWSLEVWSCLCIYKGHDGPVMSLSWGPHGHYFASGGWDKTVRIWAQDHASAQRLCVGHDTAISALTWHPNGAYVFSSSDESDKSVRMWSLSTGTCVRVFSGHTDHITALECAPDGKLLASADVGGNIFLWDIAKGERIKRCRGHGRGGIWSLSFSVESSVLASGGQDNTVRIWDVEVPTEGKSSAQQSEGDASATAAAGQGDGKAAPTNNANATGMGSTTGKKKGKDVTVTPDQISAFPTKKTPVLKVQFTRMNLVVAGGCYLPEIQDRDAPR